MFVYIPVLTALMHFTNVCYHLLAYCVLWPTQPSTLSEIGNSIAYRIAYLVWCEDLM